MPSTVSLIIPVYNEADRIIDCLRAVMHQTVQPLEVIVIDNNSTDHTAALVRLFPFVTLLNESMQGVVYARDRGFNAAQGDIIARIDADTVIADDWIETLIDVFADESLDLVTGSMTLNGIYAARIVSRVDLFWRRFLYNRLGSRLGLQGANMALRASVWQTIGSGVCHQKGLHEDFDIGIHANLAGFRAAFVEDLRVTACHRQIDSSFRPFARYALTSPRTYLAHRFSCGRIMYLVVAFVLVLYPLIYILSRGYDAESGHFSFAKLVFGTMTPRVNPATFID